jgi:predicted DNA-binding protein (MmcQ/YjbR family)
MFHDDDPGLAELRGIALGFPEAFEKVSWGRPVFCAPKIFVMYGGNARTSPGRSAPARRKTATKGEYVHYPYSVLVKVDESDRNALQQDARFYYPAYMGPSGWLGLDLTAKKKVEWDEVRELVDASYRLVATKKLIVLLDQR